jgi:protein-S-isoprenylcysteine O-methyltransferase Ste14
MNDYQGHGHLTPVSSFLESVYWLPAFAFPYIYNPPSWPAFWLWDTNIPMWMQYAGSALVFFAIVAVLAIMASLGFRRSFGREVNVLRVEGPYAISRNPQILSGYPVFVGIALRWPSWFALGWLAIMAFALHTMVLTEEQHLTNVFGRQYLAYCKRVPRYVRLTPPAAA